MNDQQAIQYHRSKIAECDQKMLQLTQVRQHHVDMIDTIAPTVRSLRLSVGAEPTKFCKYHKKFHPLSKFNKDANKPDGLYHICRLAEIAKTRARNKVKDAKGECHKCKQPALPGKKLCVKHIKKSKKSNKS